MLRKYLHYRGLVFCMSLETTPKPFADDRGIEWHGLTVVLDKEKSHAPPSSGYTATTWINASALAAQVADAEQVARNWANEQRGISRFTADAEMIGFSVTGASTLQAQTPNQ